MTQLQTPLTNLQADAAKLTTSLQSDLNPAMAQAEFTALGGQQAFNTFASDLQKFGPSAQPTITAGKQVAEMLISINKSIPAAHDQFIAWAESMGLSATAAQKLWVQVSAGEKPLASVQAGLAAGATAGQNLAASGFWGQVRDKIQGLADQVKAHPLTDLFFGVLNAIPGFTAAMDKVGSAITGLFTRVIPDAVKGVASALSGAWSTAYESFMRGFGSPMANWFTTSFPHAMAVAWNAAWSGLVTPVIKAFQDVQHAITGGFDQWWASHGHEIMQTWDAVTNDISTGAKNAFAQVAQWAKVSFDLISSTWTSFVGGLEGAWRILVGWFTGNGDLRKVLSPMWSGLVGAFQVAVAGVEAVFKLGWAFIEMTGKTAFDAMAAVLETVFDAAMVVLKVAWAAAIAAAKISWDIFVGVVNVAIDLITGHWGKAWTDMKAASVQVSNAISAFFSTT